MTSDHVENAVN